MVSIIRNHHKLLLGALLTVMVIAALIYLTKPSPITESTNDKEMPNAMKELAQEKTAEWMAGMWVELPNCKTMQGDDVSGIDIYSCTEDVIQATVTLQNGLNKAQSYYLMVLADGVPVEYHIGKNTYQTYPVELTTTQKVLDLELRSEFSLHLGRLDFLLFYDENPKSDYHMTTYTVWLSQTESEQIPLTLQSTVEQREGIQDRFTNGSYGAWLWNEDAQPTSTDQIGSREITIRQGEKPLLEVITSRPGLYRTIVMLDGQPVSFTVEGERHIWVDWESNGKDMLQIPIELSENTAKGSFFTVTTPLGAESISISNLASFKIQIVDSPEGKE